MSTEPLSRALASVTPPFPRRARARACASSTLALALLLGTGPAWAQSPGKPGLLAALEGRWTMRGDVRGKPVVYTLEARPTLQDKFVELHMRDVQVPPQYEARVFIGADTKGAVIAHWLDSTGAAGSIPHATGHIEGDTLRFTFPYPRGDFRDTFTYDRASASWLFVLESRQPDGGWKHFARYQVEKAAP